MKNKQNPSTAMNIVLWVTQILLAATFLWSAYTKLFQQADQLAAMWPWTKNNKVLVTLTAIADILAGFGLLLPGMLRIMPKLTVYACLGIIAMMIAASIFHISRGEGSLIGINVFCGVLAGFVAWGRLQKTS